MSLKNNFNKISYYFRRYGLWKTLKKVFKRIFHIKENRKTNQEQYKIWISNNEPSNELLEKQKNYKFEKNPKISIVVPMYNTNETFFKELIDCLKEQTYNNFEICLADGSEEENSNLKEGGMEEKLL